LIQALDVLTHYINLKEGDNISSKSENSTHLDYLYMSTRM